MFEEEPMELSGEGGRILPGHNDSESDMIVDSPVQTFATRYRFHTAENQAIFDWYTASQNELHTDERKVFTFNAQRERRSLYNEEIPGHGKSMPSPMRRLSEPVHKISKKQQPEINRVKDNRPLPEKSKPRKKRKLDPDEKPSRKSSSNKCCKLCLVIFCVIISVVIAFIMNNDKLCHTKIDKKYMNERFKDVYGQHIALETLKQILQDFGSNDKVYPSPLVMSFHGWTGVGKNYVTQIITDSFVRKNLNFFLIPLHFGDHSMDDHYKTTIPEWILGNITKCTMNIFVFDEMGSASEGVISGLETTLLNLRNQNESKSQSLFIFLSNSKAGKINDLLFSKLSKGRSRTSLQINDFMSSLLTDADEEWYLQLYKKNLIDVFVPFLPLNDDHVVKCIKKDLISKGRQPNADLIQAVKNDLMYFKSKSGETYSLTGCKRVSDKVDLHVSD